jgi:ribosomal protein S18 acetylase RimI-like enzyme
MEIKNKYFSLNDFEKIDFLIQIEFDETNEKWNLLKLIIENKHEYDLARIQALKIIEIANIPKYHKDIFVQIIYNIIINENDYGVKNHASSAASNFVEYYEIEKIIIEKVLNNTEDIDIRYSVFGAYDNKKMIGFSVFLNNKFGSKNNYIRLKFLHISFEYRHKGIGKTLFELCVEKAKNKGIEKIYISAANSEASQIFYLGIGCKDAMEINKIAAENEPYDRQMEYIIK